MRQMVVTFDLYLTDMLAEVRPVEPGQFVAELLRPPSDGPPEMIKAIREKLPEAAKQDPFLFRAETLIGALEYVLGLLPGYRPTAVTFWPVAEPDLQGMTFKLWLPFYPDRTIVCLVADEAEAFVADDNVAACTERLRALESFKCLKLLNGPERGFEITFGMAANEITFGQLADIAASFEPEA